MALSPDRDLQAPRHSRVIRGTTSRKLRPAKQRMCECYRSITNILFDIRTLSHLLTQSHNITSGLRSCKSGDHWSFAIALVGYCLLLAGADWHNEVGCQGVSCYNILSIQILEEWRLTDFLIYRDSYLPEVSESRALISIRLNHGYVLTSREIMSSYCSDPHNAVQWPCVHLVIRDASNHQDIRAHRCASKSRTICGS